jgi:hypothetical protein
MIETHFCESKSVAGNTAAAEGGYAGGLLYNAAAARPEDARRSK